MPEKPRGFDASPVPERKEREIEQPALTVYLLRHGESGTDKTDPKRGLTDRGREQVRQAFTAIINQIIRDENPDFNQWSNPDAKREALGRALKKVEIHLRDSSTDRTIEQEWIEYDQLRELGVPPEQINMPRSAFTWKDEMPRADSGPGIAKRLAGVGGLTPHPEFRKMLGDPAYQQRVGATDEMVAWALTPEDEIPAGVEKRSQMVERKNNDLTRVERLAQRLAQRNYSKRPVVIANSHSSIITLTASDELDIPIQKLGEVPNAEGLRLDFFGSGKSHTTRAFGETLEVKAKKE